MEEARCFLGTQLECSSFLIQVICPPRPSCEWESQDDSVISFAIQEAVFPSKAIRCSGVRRDVKLRIVAFMSSRA